MSSPSVFDKNVLDDGDDTEYMPLHYRITVHILTMEVTVWLSCFVAALIGYVLFPRVGSWPILTSLTVMVGSMFTLVYLILTVNPPTAFTHGHRVAFAVFWGAGLAPMIVFTGVQLQVAAPATLCLMQWASSMGPLFYIVRYRRDADPRHIWKFMAGCALLAWAVNLIADHNRWDVIGSIVVLLIEVVLVAYRYLWFVNMVIKVNDYRADECDRAWCNLYTELPKSIFQASQDAILGTNKQRDLSLVTAMDFAEQGGRPSAPKTVPLPL